MSSKILLLSETGEYVLLLSDDCSASFTRLHGEGIEHLGEELGNAVESVGESRVSLALTVVEEGEDAGVPGENLAV